MSRPYARAPRSRPPAKEVEGLLHMNQRGFGFVRTAEDHDDVFVAPDAVAGALHGDRVRARLGRPTRKGLEGEVVEVLERRSPRIVGVLRGRPGGRYLVPDDGRIRGPIPVEDDDDDDAAPGRAAVVDITRFPREPRETPQGRLVAVLGAPGDPDVEVAKVLIARGIVEDHADGAVAEADAFGAAPDPDELTRREDLRDIPFVTIDPADARDHDDAVWVERDEAGRYHAWIAIADVSHYVTAGSDLDESARRRAFSVYLPDRAVPMLPRALSGSLCSLLAGEERLCLCVYVALDPTGKPIRRRIIEGRMTARAFLTYPSVARALGFTAEPPRDPEAEARRHELQVAWDLASLLRKRRMRRGALDFDLPEARIDIDPDTRAPVAIAERRDDPGVRKAYRLIEEMMLLANETVAAYALEHQIPVVYRVHGVPDPDKLARFALAADQLGVDFDPEVAESPRALSKFMRRLEAHPKRDVLQNLLLRSMQQASYDTVNGGHYGLASSAYLHFTSPIRRYPDLLVHRALRRQLRLSLGLPRGRKPPEATEEADVQLREAARHCSEAERNVAEAEREIADVYRTLYMRAFVGDVFEGRVTSITGGGLYVRLVDPFVDVFVPLDQLGPDRYEPDERGLFTRGQRSGERIRLGDAITVVIEDVAVLRRMVYGRRTGGASPRDLRHDPVRRPPGRRRRKEARLARATPRKAKGRRRDRRATKGRKRR
ncbi:MAG: VacB/RNase II family 3'-5' exoribonuclease [Myxococcota bacterium]